MSYKKWILVSAVIFFLSTIVGLLSPSTSLETLGPLEEPLKFIGSLSSPGLFLFIMLNNMLTVTLSFAMSPLLCLLPLLSLTLNGWVVGAVVKAVVQQESLSFALVGILPHGIIEIPALLMAQAAALGFGSTLILAVFRKEKRSQVAPTLLQNLKYLGISLLLLIPAALVEAYVTPFFMGLLRY